MRFRKKPVVIDAIQFEYTKAGIDQLAEFCGSSLKGCGIDVDADLQGWAHIGTLEDGAKGQAKHVATEGDWIIKGIRGEFYPCKPEIFAATYEAVESDLSDN